MARWRPGHARAAGAPRREARPGGHAAASEARGAAPRARPPPRGSPTSAGPAARRSGRHRGVHAPGPCARRSSAEAGAQRSSDRPVGGALDGGADPTLGRWEPAVALRPAPVEDPDVANDVHERHHQRRGDQQDHDGRVHGYSRTSSAGVPAGGGGSRGKMGGAGTHGRRAGGPCSLRGSPGARPADRRPPSGERRNAKRRHYRALRRLAPGAHGHKGR